MTRWLKNLIRFVLRGVSFRIPLRYHGRWIRLPIVRGEGLCFLNSIAHRDYEWMFDLLSRLPNHDGRQFVDVGAHLGESLMVMKGLDRSRPYLGFEPNTLCVDYLKEFIRTNGYQECTVVPFALSDQSGETILLLETPTASGGTIVADLRPQREHSRVPVSTVVFDEIRREVAPGPIGLIKVDTEAAEDRVLAGMCKTLGEDRPVVLCEVLWTDPLGDPRLTTERNRRTLDLLESLGYAVYHVLKGRGRPLTLERVREFPEGIWSPENADLCDYLFVPDPGRLGRIPVREG